MVHPGLVLTHMAVQRAIITTISAYSTESNHFLPPWQQPCHRSKDPAHFRAFEGTRRPDERHPPLRLADPATMRMPKSAASWVFVRNFYAVPFSVLGVFNRSPVLLRVHPQSLAQLKADVARFERRHRDACARLAAGSAASAVADRSSAGTSSPSVCGPAPRCLDGPWRRGVAVAAVVPPRAAQTDRAAVAGPVEASRSPASGAVTTWASVAAAVCSAAPAGAKWHVMAR